MIKVALKRFPILMHARVFHFHKINLGMSIAYKMFELAILTFQFGCAKCSVVMCNVYRQSLDISYSWTVITISVY